MAAISIFKCTEVAGAVSRFDTYLKWPPLMQSLRSRRYYGKIGGPWTIYTQKPLFKLPNNGISGPCLTLSYSYWVAHRGSNLRYKQDAPGRTTVLQNWKSSRTGWGLSTIRGLNHGEGTSAEVIPVTTSFSSDFNSETKYATWRETRLG